MKSKVLYSDKIEDEVTCDSEELRRFISKWLKKQGWKFDDFLVLLKLVGINTPVKLSDLKENSFQCITALEEKITIQLVSSVIIPFFLEVRLMKIKNGSKEYSYEINRKSKRGITDLSVFFVREADEEFDKFLLFHYTNQSCEMYYRFGNYYGIITINFDSFLGKKSEIRRLVNKIGLKDYLWNHICIIPLSVSEMYEKIRELLDSSNESLKYCDILIHAYDSNDENFRDRVHYSTWKKELLIEEKGICMQYFFEFKRWKYTFEDGTIISVSGTESDNSFKNYGKISQNMETLKDILPWICRFLKE